MKRVVVIGLDGATFDIMLPWIKEGRLPNLAKIMNEGCYGYLESTPDKVSPSAWTSFATGMNPGKHGIFHFYTVDPATFNVRINNSTYRDGEPIWSYFSRSEKKVCVVNVPSTFPAENVNGCMVSGWDAPSIKNAGFTHPPELIDEIIEKFKDYPLTPTIKKYTISQPELAIKDLDRVFQIRAAVSKHLLEKNDWDLFVAVFTSVDQAQHHFWHHIDGRHPLYDPKALEKYGNAILDSYKKCDDFLSEVWKHADENTTVVIMSDHGAGINSMGAYYLPVWLERMGLLRFKEPGLRGKGLKGLARRLLRKLSRNLSYATRQRLKKALSIKESNFELRMKLEFSGYDWLNTKVYPVGPNLQINLKGREAHGTVSPGEEYERIVDLVMAKLRGCKDLKTGRPIVKDVLRKENAYHGKHRDEAPDLIIRWADDFVISGILGTSAQGAGIRIPDPGMEIEWSGEHSDYGVFMIKGPDVKKGIRIEDANIMDITPSIIHLMGMPVPKDMDGKILEGIFLEDFKKKNPIRTTDGASSTGREKELYSDDEDGKIKEHLKNLGYL